MTRIASDRVTAFVTTVGRSTFKSCLEHLTLQNVNHVLEVIAGVSPLSAALQRMSDTCKTEYFVQVDEDMLLTPDALERCVHQMDRTDPERFVMGIQPLYDVELQMNIYGLKTYRTALVRLVPFEDHPHGDVHDRDLWSAAGLHVAKESIDGHPAGRHGTHYTPTEAFARWRRLWQSHRASRNLKWVEEWPAKLAVRAARGDRSALGALLGCMVGIHGPLAAGGPDARRIDFELEGLTRLFDLSDAHDR